MFNLKNSRHMFFAMPLLILFISLSSCSGTAGWHQLKTQTSPPATTGAAVAYNSQHQNAILFGGSIGSVENNAVVWNWFDETWGWDGKNWEKLSPIDHPSGREKHVMTYDESRDRIVLFGGATTSSLFNDTWEWDGNNWQLMHPKHMPPPRCCSAMAYDSDLKRVILYGGWNSQQNIFFNDVWSWDGKDWSELPGSAPQMSGHFLIDFPPKNEMLSIMTPGETWAWDGRRLKSLELERIPSRSEVRAVYDPNNQRIILFGGIRDKDFLNDTWIFDGESWFELNLPSSPSPRWGHVMFYDTKRNSVIMFGGFQNDNQFLNDTWELQLPRDLSVFKSVVPSIPRP